jgi:nucleoside-diphosphate-sugar epimerase
MKDLPKKAVVVGALGVIGRYIVDKLLAEGDWQVVGLSRRPARNEPRYSHIPVDLLDLKDAGKKLGGLSDITHVFYAAFQPGTGAAADYASVIAPNRDMLVNSVTAIAKASRDLRRVVLVTGTNITACISGRSRRRCARPIRATCRPISISIRSTG